MDSSHRRDGRTTLRGRPGSRTPTRSPQRGGRTQSVLIYGRRLQRRLADRPRVRYILTRDPETSNLPADRVLVPHSPPVPASDQSGVPVSYPRGVVCSQNIQRAVCGSGDEDGAPDHHSGGRSQTTYERRVLSSVRYWWTKAIAMLPSPTAAATRFTGLYRTSPQAKMPGTLVSRR